MIPRAVPILLAAIVLAGCASPSHGHGAGDLDTGEIAPGAEASLMFHDAGTYAMHCHPHPWMEHAVTVADGGPSSARIEILDDLSNETAYRYEPANVTIGVGGTVTYVNRGTFVHTATQETE